VPKNIAILTYEFPVVSETFVVDHVVGMARRGWTPTVVCQRTHPERLRSVLERVPGLRVERLAPLRDVPYTAPRHLLELASAGARFPNVLRWTHGRNAVVMAPGLARTLREIRPDVVHAHFGPNGVAAAVALRGRVPLVVDFHGFDFTSFTQTAGWELYRTTLRSSTLVVHSTFAAERVRAGLGRDALRVPLGVDLSTFKPAPRSSQWPTPIRLLAVGRLVPVKGLPIAIQALRLLRLGAPPLPARLRIVGDGPDRPSLQDLARNLGVAECVEFTGPVAHDQVAKEMEGADMLIVPSLKLPDGSEEAFGRVVIEGLAAGLAVVVSGIGGLPETVGEAGVVVPPGDPSALASAVRRVLESGTPNDWMVRSSERAQIFSIERMWDEYEDLARRAACPTR
jgi:colanic acid/amylovoran biosynthesis glycosyltransferase